MIAVIFEVTPAEENRSAYLDIASQLRPHLQEIDGFISVERFESLVTPGKLLSLSYWRDEASVKAWRKQQDHRVAQHTGRKELFETYRIRVATVLRDYGPDTRAQAPADNQP